MNNAHIESKAVPSDQKGVQSIVRRFAACCLIGVMAMSVAHAGPRDREREAQQYQQYQQAQQYEQPQQHQRESTRGERGQRQSDQRQYEQRQDEQRAEDQRRQQMQQEQQAQSGESGRRGGRLTPDERRDLRRQINEAGADIYPSRTRR